MGVAFWLSYAGVTIFILLVLFAIDLWAILMILGWIVRKKYENFKKRNKR